MSFGFIDRATHKIYDAKDCDLFRFQLRNCDLCIFVLRSEPRVFVGGGADNFDSTAREADAIETEALAERFNLPQLREVAWRGQRQHNPEPLPETSIGVTPMASRIVMELIVATAMPIGSVIRKGKRLPTLCGTIAGGMLGLSGGLISIPVAVATVLLGAIGGAALAALLFKRLPSLPVRTTDIEPFQLGAVLRSWSFEHPDFKSLSVLLERAFYTVCENSAPWNMILQKLNQGEVPDLFMEELIRLDEIIRIEMNNPEATDIQIVHALDGRTRRCSIYFRTLGERDELLTWLERHFGGPFRREERSLEFTRMIRAPLVVATIVAVLFAGVAWLSQYWTDNPPPFPIGKAEPDPLVSFLTKIGPVGVLLIGAAPVLAALVWLSLRLLHPPQVLVLSVRDE
jgi:hypothetical protein